MQNNEYVVEMRGIDKIYPNGIAANQGVDFLVKKGEIHALMGENGAGKSTLMKMLFGMEQPTNGEIFINGEKVALTSPTVAIAHGIGMVHQHFMLVPSLTVAENVVLGMEPRKGKLFVDFSKAIALTEEYSKKFNLEVDPNAKVMDIPVGMKQKVEILKALVRGAKILILDEPTAVLTTQETVELFKELVHLKEQGYTIIFISHKLKEIKEITDRMTILRGGRSMGVYNTADTSEQEISRLMVGRDVILSVEKEQAQPTDVVLRVKDLEYTNEWNRKMLNKVSFAVRKGEILGIAGVEGNGQAELVEMLFNLNRPDGGTAEVNGKNILGVAQDKIREMGVSLNANSPHKLVQNWHTPILCIHGGMDFRVPYDEGMAAFNAAQMMGVPSKLIVFPGENHWILKPQNALYWHRSYFDWLNRWLVGIPDQVGNDGTDEVGNDEP